MHLSASQRADSFFGTDLSYEDLEPKHAEDYEVTVLGHESFEGVACTRIEFRPKPELDSSYERMESCVEPERAIMLWTDFYNRGKHWKRLEIELAEVRPVQERFIPFRMIMSIPRRQSQTVIETESYELRPEIPETLFSLFNLESGDAKRDHARSGADRAAEVPDVAAGPGD
jgi:hypothetical protein